MDLARAARHFLERGCGTKNGRASGEGVACRKAGLQELLFTPEETRFDRNYRTPCTKQGRCIPYFYILGTFHAGCRDLYDRMLDAAPQSLFVPRSRRDGSYPYYFSETHMWERMLWRGCDFGNCPRRRGVGAEPLHLESELPELRAPLDDGSVGNGGKRPRLGPTAVFGEVAGGSLTFTWSSAHSLLHYAWDKNQSACRSPHPRTKCFPAACEAQRELEQSVGAGRERHFTIPWLMRAVHGSVKVRLIGLLREPGERMWSAYHFWPQYRRRYGKQGKEPEGFLKYLQHVIPAFEACLKAAANGDFGRPPRREANEGRMHGSPTQWELETCAINFESLSSDNEGVYYHCDQLLKSLYMAYVPTWHAAFGKERLLLLRAEDYWANPGPVLKSALSFLGVPPLAESQLSTALAKPVRPLHGSNSTFWGDKTVVNSHVTNSRPRWPGHIMSRIKSDMLKESREALDAFFAPYNERLAALLGHAKWTWKDRLLAR